MSEPLHQTILLTDIEGSGQSDDLVRRVRRHHMYEAVQYALEAAEVRRTDQRLEDRGDGVMVLVSATVPKAALLRAVLSEIPARLHGYNRVAAASAQVRLRVVLAAGEVALDEIPGALGGVVGWDLDQAFRLLDGEPLRQALRHGSDADGMRRDAAVCVSEAVYRGVVRHDHHGIRRDAFHPVTVAGKEGPVHGWLYGVPAPDGTPRGRPARDAREERSVGDETTHEAPSRRSAGGIAFHGGSPSFGGSLVAGDQHGVSGGTVVGDVVMGSKITNDSKNGEPR
jgi:hypothetical protein